MINKIPAPFNLLAIGTALAILASACSASPTSAPRFPAGTTVILGNSADALPVGLWLMYEDTCSVDITYNFVPGGTPAVISGRICQDAGTLYYKVTLSAEVMEANQITSSNTWIEEDEITASQ